MSDNVTVTNFTVGGSFQSGTAAVTVEGDSSLTISAGTYGSRNADGTVKGAVVGGGLLQNTKDASGSYFQDGNVNVLINGGTIDTVLFGAGAARVPLASEKMKLNGDVSITVDATNAVSLYEVYAGFNGAGSISGNTTITFKGSGANLTFATVENETYNGVCGDNAGKSGIASKKTRTLAFDSFTGDFTANNIKKFDKISLTGSTVTFTQSGLNLSPVKTWDFAAGSSLTWTGTGDDYFASNTFAGDTLVFGHENESLTGSWTVMTGNADTLSGWDDVGNTVMLFKQKAAFADGAWKTSAFSLTLQEENKLVVSALTVSALA